METFTPTTTQIRAAAAVFIAMAHEQVIREIVEDYQSNILSRHNFKNRYDGTIIKNPHKDWEMCDEDFTIYLEECKTEREIVGLKVQSEDNCPLLEAQNILISARRNLVDTFEDTFNVSADRLLCLGLEKYNEYIELLLGLLAPYTKQVKEINNILSK